MLPGNARNLNGNTIEHKSRYNGLIKVSQFFLLARLAQIGHVIMSKERNLMPDVGANPLKHYFNLQLK